MFRQRIAAVTSGLLAAATLAATASHASSTERVTRVVLKDGTGDVWRLHELDEGGGSDVKLAFPRADVKRVVVRHATFALHIRMRFSDLRKVRGHASQDFFVDIRTSSGRKLLASVEVDAHHPQGRRSIQDHADLRRQPCALMTHQINYATNLVRMRIPRSCLGRPRWVKVEVSNELNTGVLQFDPISYEDNPHNHRRFPSGRDYTRRLYRG